MQHPSVSDGEDGGPTKSTTKLVDKTGNQINTIYPYRTKGGWAFDDADVGLKGEPFIAGIPAIIDKVVGKRDSFTAHISHSPIPKHTLKLVAVKAPEEADTLEKELNNGWYEMDGTGMVGWLCPATLKYFKDYPKEIYVKIE